LATNVEPLLEEQTHVRDTGFSSLLCLSTVLLRANVALDFRPESIDSLYLGWEALMRGKAHPEEDFWGGAEVFRFGIHMPVYLVPLTLPQVFLLGIGGIELVVKLALPFPLEQRYTTG
jgi:hypothetical protein